MGCDIHLFVERKAPQGWVAVGAEGEYYDDRDYLLFAHLAGVRNREGVTPIAEPRGLPTDMSSIVRDYMGNEYGYDYHSRSWLTLAELLEHDWPDGLRGWREDNLERVRQLVTTDPHLTADDVRIVFAFDN